MQCMVSAMMAGTAASGTRAYLAQRHLSWMTPKRLRRITVGLLGSAVLASSLLVSGSDTRPHHPVKAPAAIARTP
jgi:hypothetical protein